MPISRRTHHLPFVRNGFSDSARNFGLGTTLKPFGLRRLNKSARALGPEGRNWVLRRFQKLRSYHDEIETRNQEEIPYSSRIVPRGLSVAEGP